MLAPLATDDPDAARCDANRAMTLEREMRGLRPGSTLGFIGMGGFIVEATAPSETIPSLAEGLSGWLKILPLPGD